MSKKFKAAFFIFAVLITVMLTSLCVLTVSNQFKFNTLIEMYESERDAYIHEIYDDTAVINAYISSDSSALDEKDKYVLDTASKIIKKIIKDDMTDYEKEKAVYDWLFKYVNFDEGSFAAIPTEDDNSTPYGVLKSRSAICVGNATTFKLFMGMLGIDCKIIHSTEAGEHAWNMVKLDNEWYHCDLTFDGGYKEPKYMEFNMPDSVASRNGFSYDHAEFPRAESVKYCYIYQTAKYLKDVYKIPPLIKEAMDNETKYLYVKYEATVERNEYGETITSIMSDIIDSININYLYDSNTSLSLTEMLLDKSVVGIIEIEGNDDSGGEAFDFERLDKEAAGYFDVESYG